MSKTAIVTGASRGIGRAIALKLAEEGWCVAVNYHSSQKEAEELVSLIGQGASIAVCADVSQKAEACRLVREAKDRFGFVDLLVNNAGISDYSLFQDLSLIHISLPPRPKNSTPACVCSLFCRILPSKSW